MSLELERYNNMIQSVQIVITRSFNEFLEKFWSSNYLSGKLRHYYSHVFSVIKYLKSNLEASDQYELVDFEKRFIFTCKEYKLNLDVVSSNKFKKNLKPKFLHSFLKRLIEKL